MYYLGVGNGTDSAESYHNERMSAGSKSSKMESKISLRRAQNNLRVHNSQSLQIKNPHCENFLKPLCLSPNLRRQYGFSPPLVLTLLGLASDSARL